MTAKLARQTYDPFVRGPDPAGVRSGLLVDRVRGGRELAFEVWYPADPGYKGADLDAATQDAFTVEPDAPPIRQAAVRDAPVRPGRHPLVLFSHTSHGHRRQSSFLCTHLASHGYVVAAADHAGNTASDLASRAAGTPARTDAELDAYVRRIIADRVPDIRLLADSLLGGAVGEVSDTIDAARLGLIGWSFGGWAVLATPEVDARFGAVVAIVPAGSSTPLPGIIPAMLTFDWRRPAPVLYLAAERDEYTPLPGIRELLDRTPSPAAMFVLRDAGHDHFGDRITNAPPTREQAQLFTRGLALAHLDAVLRDDAAARTFLADQATTALRSRGVDAVADNPR